MNLANLENCKEQFRLSDATGFNADRINDYLGELIEQAEAELPVVPTVEVGQVWRSNKYGYRITVIAVHDDAAWCKYSDSSGFQYGTNTSAYLLANYTLQTPAPEVVEVRAPEVSNNVLDAYTCTYVSCSGLTQRGRRKAAIAAAITAYLAEKNNG